MEGGAPPTRPDQGWSKDPPREYFLTARQNERIQRCPVCHFLLGAPSLLPLSGFHFPSIREISPPLSWDPLLHAPSPSPHAGLLTTGRSVPFPPPARRTFARTREGTSRRLGRAEMGWGRGRRKQGWVMLWRGQAASGRGQKAGRRKVSQDMRDCGGTGS